MNKTILEVITWDEPTLESFSEENAISIAHVKYKASGHMNGTITSTYVIHYTHYVPKKPHDAESTFTGYFHFIGKVDGKMGSVVFQESGYHIQALKSTLTIKKYCNRCIYNATWYCILYI